MRVTATPEFINSLPISLRQRLHLTVGMVLDFDEQVPYLKAIPTDSALNNDTEFRDWLNSSIGLAKGQLTTDQRMAETRGED